MKTKLIGVLSLAAAFFVSTSATTATKATPVNPTELFTAESAIGGYRIDSGSKKKQQIIGFGFTAKTSLLPGLYTDYGIDVYEDESCSNPVADGHRESWDIETLSFKVNGRFYAIFDCNGGSSPKPGVTYYGRGYLHYMNDDGMDIYKYSSVVSAKSNLTTEYSIPE